MKIKWICKNIKILESIVIMKLFLSFFQTQIFKVYLAWLLINLPILLYFICFICYFKSTITNQIHLNSHLNKISSIPILLIHLNHVRHLSFHLHRNTSFKAPQFFFFNFQYQTFKIHLHINNAQNLYFLI